MTNYQTEVAKALLDIEAVKLQPNDPFTWASGIKSPIYTDNRKIISFPEERQVVIAGLVDLIKTHYPDVQVIGGVATAGIPHAAWVAQEMNLPLIYVRAKPKDHGTGKQIEGALTQGQKVVLIDDLISTGGSVLGAVKATRAEAGDVIGVVSIFSYELPAADKNFATAQTNFASLSNFSSLLQVAQHSGKITANELTMIQEWRQTLI
ncbi:orotate phosphoribosyltransferase [Weissella bombi]|uniref:Orotate phosphoribosyltransferase n=1 Tax=Weissella bombi TaxID=1505725 RepID=A0A1C4A9R1_9LACO|nr:orotate phosphoribosyltransferase [Weissella bombi]SCB91444.1 orotate phosphoribosyltransferase [Weissella bombi]